MSMGGGGSSGGGGGGGSGAIDYPAYMKSWHQSMLGNVQVLVNAAGETPPITYMYDPKAWFGMPAPGNSPYKLLASFVALNTKQLFKDFVGDTDTFRYVLGESAIADIKAQAVVLRGLLVDPAGADQTCTDMIDAHAAKVLQKVNSDVMPKVEIGMRDLNAVIGTSFVIAKELAMEDYTHEVADFSAKARMRVWELRQELYKYIEGAWMQGAVHAAEVGMKRVAMEMEKLKLQTSMTSELANVAVLAQSKYGVVQTEKETRAKTWKLDLYNHMNACLASIAGAHTVTQGNTQASAIFSGALGFGAMGAGIGAYLGAGSTLGGLAGGAEAGGAMGMAGGPAGAILGAVAGGAVGILSGLFRR